MTQYLRFGTALFTAALAAGCGPSYSPNTYASAAVQQANKVERGVIVGVRRVDVSSQGAIGAVSGGAAGGLLGSQVPGSSLGTAFGTIGGTVIGGIVGTTAEHVVADTAAFEYVVRKPNGELVSVTQKDERALRIGDKVLVIAGSQARIVVDYTVPDSSLADVPHAPALPAPPNGTAPPPAPVASEPLPPPASAPAALALPSLNPSPAVVVPSAPAFSLPGAAAIAPAATPGAH